MRSYTQIEKRRLNYQQKLPDASHLDLPQCYKNKISHIQHKKIKDAFFINAQANLTLTKLNFATTIRSLGIVKKTSQIYQIYQQNPQKIMSWQAFLQVYMALRNHKGSFKQVDTAVNMLDKQYNGRWQQIYEDLVQIGDVLSQQQLQIFKKKIVGDKILNADNLKNIFLGYK